MSHHLLKLYSYGECGHRYANAIPGQWTNATLVSHHVPSLCLNTRSQLMVASATELTEKHIFHRRSNITQLMLTEEPFIWDDCLCAVCCMFVVHSHMPRSNIISVKVLIIISGTHQLLHFWHAIGQVRWQLFCGWTDRHADRQTDQQHETKSVVLTLLCDVSLQPWLHYPED